MSDDICPFCAGTGKLDLKNVPVEPYSAATNVVFDLDQLKDLKLIAGT